MSQICDCDEEFIPDVDLVDCPESMGQIQKAFITKIYSTGTTKNSIADPTLLANITPLLTAADGTKMVQTPYLEDPISEAGAARTFGGGNVTRGGVSIIIGREQSTFTSMINRYQQKTIAALKKLACYNVGVYLIDENGLIGCIVDDVDTPTAYFPIPVGAFFVGDKKLGGLEAPDSNVVSWEFFPNWSDNFALVKPSDYNPIDRL